MTMLPPGPISSAAEVYDELYAWKDYASEAATVRQLLGEAGLKWEARILEGACGSGRYLEHLAPHFEVAGFDLNVEMLAAARSRLPKRVLLFEGDLCRLSLPRVDAEPLAPFDALLLLFGGLGYVPPDQLLQALDGLASALRPGGVFVCEPWLNPEQFIPDRPHLLVVDKPGLKISRQVVTRVEGRKSILDYWILVARPGHDVQVLRDLNVLHLYTTEELKVAFQASGFTVDRVRPGFMSERDLWICRRN